jgi:NAD(P)-dependent dehydrogenase (short-subunit alcohol dehydrogenase family)
MRLAGRVALITGGGSGIGRGVANRFAEEGADVAVADMNLEGAQAVAREVEHFEHRSVALAADVTKKADCERIVQETVAQLGKIDILMANAGIGRFGPFLDYREEDWNAVIDTNLTGVFFSCQAAARQMVKQGHGGRIICTASLAAVRPGPMMPAYYAAKAGVKMLTEAMAVELAAHKITVNSIGPGLIDTPLTAPIMQAIADERRSQSIPLGRVGEPKDVANLALFLASDDAEYITGDYILVDGGLGLGRLLG